MSESFEKAFEKVEECVDGVACWSYTTSGWCEGYEKCGDCKQAARQTIDRLKRAHEHELEQLRKTEYARGYEDGQRSMDAEHRAVALRLKHLPLDEDSHGNLSQIARAVWHNDFGWTTDACRALRDELVRLLGGIAGETCTMLVSDELEDERQTAVCWLQDWDPHNSFDSDCQGEVHIRILYQLLNLGGAMMMDGADAAVAVRDCLIHLLGGDEPTLLKAATELSQASVDAMSKRADQSHESSPMEQESETGIADELRECVNTATKSYDDTPWHEMDGTTEAEHTICYVTEAELTDIAEHIDAEHAKQCRLLDDSWQATCEQMMKDYDGETAELRAAIVGYKERAAALEDSERLRHELERERDSLKRAAERDADHIESLESMYDQLHEEHDAALTERDDLREHCENQRKRLAELEGVVNRWQWEEGTGWSPMAADKAVRRASKRADRLRDAHHEATLQVAALTDECQMYRDMLNDAVGEYMELYGVDAETICRLRNDSLMYRTMLNDAADQYRDINTERVFACHERDAYLRDLLEGGVPATDESMAEHGWVRLPKDANGEYIRVGCSVSPVTALDSVLTVTQMTIRDDGWHIRAGGDRYECERESSFFKVCEHKPDSTELVLREFARKYLLTEIDSDEENDLVSEYAKMLEVRE